MTRFAAIAASAICALSCAGAAGSGNFTREELALIEGADSIMRVLTIADPCDLKVLRNTSGNLSADALASEEYDRLCSLMVATVTHPSQDGVGIAGPQVGINRRIVAVQRFDKPGEPFEIYPNIRIVWASDSLAAGYEGCLSVPDRREEVMRSTEIVIEYSVLQTSGGTVSGRGTDESDCSDDLSADQKGGLTGDKTGSGYKIMTVRETVSGFTAVIFQHETDHLDGVLYIDRLQVR